MELSVLVFKMGLTHSKWCCLFRQHVAVIFTISVLSWHKWFIFKNSSHWKHSLPPPPQKWFGSQRGRKHTTAAQSEECILELQKVKRTARSKHFCSFLDKSSKISQKKEKKECRLSNDADWAVWIYSKRGEKCFKNHWREVALTWWVRLCCALPCRLKNGNPF